jgi:serine protease
VPRLLRFSLALLAVCCLVTVTTASAHQAGTVYMKINKDHAARPHGSSNLAYRGGPVSVTAAVYIVFWGDWSNSTSAESYVTGFFGNVGGSAWANSTKQYCQGTFNGATSCSTSLPHPANAAKQLAGTWNDTTNPVPASPTQSQIQAEAGNAAAFFGVTPNANDDFMVFTPSGRSQNGFGTQWCAYHSSSGSLSYSYIPYQPDAGVSCGQNFVNAGAAGSFDGFSIVGGHEYAETITDPEPNSGWLDRQGSENGDKCAWIAPGSGPGGATNLFLGGGIYAVQSLWSNAAGGCVTSS